MTNRAPRVLLAGCSILFVVILAIWILFVSIVDAGHVGVQVTFGNVSDSVLEAGFHLKNPFTEVIQLTSRTQDYTMSSVSGEGEHFGDDSIKVLTADGSSVWLDVTVLYHLRSQDASKLYREIGPDYAEKVIRPQIRSNIREVISGYGVVEVYSSKRSEIQQKLFDEMQKALDARGIEVEDVLLRDVVLTQELADSIGQKLAAQQEAEKLNFEIEKAKKEAERQVIEAQGQRDAQRIIGESLTANYLNYLYIQNLQNLQGTIYVPVDPNNGLPLFRNVN